jgi:hypothetical protein
MAGEPVTAQSLSSLPEHHLGKAGWNDRVGEACYAHRLRRRDDCGV